jgi:tetratricopeptide (TPR) repeat protein
MFLKYRLRQTDPRMKRVYSHFARNLADILALAREHGVKVVLSTVATNLKDCAPFGSEHRPGLGPSRLRQWRRLMSAGVTAEQAGEGLKASTLFAKAGQIDDQFAALQFHWGRCCLAAGRNAEARRHFILARDEDTLRFRADTRINDLIRAAAAGRGSGWVRLADAERVFEGASPSGLPGNNLLYDHVHLSFKGNYLLAQAIAGQVAKLLPSGVVRHAVAPAWMPMAECARRLAWTDWSRYRAARSMMLRVNQPPFDSKSDYAEQYARLRRRLELFLPATRPSGLRQAAGVCRQALALRPGDWVLWRNLGELQAGIGDLAGAEQSYRHVAEELPYEGLAWLELGFVLVQESRPEQALAQFATGLRLKPDSVAMLNGAALAQGRLGSTSRALRACQRALELNPAAFDTRVNLGTLLQALGRKQAAAAQFREVLSRDIETPENLAQLGDICLGQGWIAAAITNFTKALLLNPTDAEAQFGLGGAFELEGRHAAAQTHFAEAVRLDPEQARARVGLGAELLRQGQVLQAVEQLSQAARLQPRLTPARLDLGIALLRLGRVAEARCQFEAALRLDPNNAFARHCLARVRNQDVKAPAWSTAGEVRTGQGAIKSVGQARGQSSLFPR